MNKLFYILFLLLFFSGINYSQENLVPNPSFEEYNTDSCNWNSGDFDPYISNWLDPNQGSSDFFHSCNSQDMNVPDNSISYHFANSGEGFAGISFYIEGVLNYREYIQVELNDSLLKGERYDLNYYVAVANFNTENYGNYISNCFQVYLCRNQDLWGNPMLLDVLPTVINDTYIGSENWTKISYSFIAKGGEKFLTIGCFENDYDIGIQSFVNDSMYSPQQCYYFIDDVNLFKSPKTYTSNVSNIFTPNNDDLNENFVIQTDGYLNASIKIYNRWGNSVFESNDINFKWNGSECSNGTYYYILKLFKEDNSFDIKKGYVQLIR